MFYWMSRQPVSQSTGKMNSQTPNLWLKMWKYFSLLSMGFAEKVIKENLNQSLRFIRRRWLVWQRFFLTWAHWLCFATMTYYTRIWSAMRKQVTLHLLVAEYSDYHCLPHNIGSYFNKLIGVSDVVYSLCSHKELQGLCLHSHPKSAKNVRALRSKLLKGGAGYSAQWLKERNTLHSARFALASNSNLFWNCRRWANLLFHKWIWFLWVCNCLF